MLYKLCTSSPLGPLTIISSKTHIIALSLEGQSYSFKISGENLQDGKGHPVLTQARHWLERYFSGQKPLPEELPLAPEGSDFRRFIWQELCCIPYGTTVTYGFLAKRAMEAFRKSAMSAQAVGGAVGHNPISIIIPCHRVVGAQGRLTGYTGGIDIKIKLLTLEGLDMDMFRH